MALKTGDRIKDLNQKQRGPYLHIEIESDEEYPANATLNLAELSADIASYLLGRPGITITTNQVRNKVTPDA